MAHYLIPPSLFTERSGALTLRRGSCVLMQSLRYTWIRGVPVKAMIHRGDVGLTVKAIIGVQNRQCWYTSWGALCSGEFISISHCTWSDSANRPCSHTGNWLLMEEKNIFCWGSYSRSCIITTSHRIHYWAHYAARVNISGYHIFCCHITVPVSWYCAIFTSSVNICRNESWG